MEKNENSFIAHLKRWKLFILLAPILLGGASMIYILGFGKSIEDIQDYIGGVLIAAVVVALNYNSNIFAKIAMYIVSAISISSIYLVILIITLAIAEEL